MTPIGDSVKILSREDKSPDELDSELWESIKHLFDCKVHYRSVSASKTKIDV